MGRSFESVRMGVQEMTGRFERAARALPGGEGEAALMVVSMARQHASESFYAFDDPLEAALFSVFIEVLKAREGRHVDH
jgi:hypothetical protein